MRIQSQKLPFRHLALFAASTALLNFVGAALSPRATAQITNWSVSKELIAAADKEGSLILLVIPNSTHREYLAAAWPKAFPNIKLQQIFVPPGTEVARIGVERGAGKYLWDVGFTGTDNAFQMRDEGFLDPFGPELAATDVKDPKTWGGWNKVYMDKDEKYVFASRHFLKMPFYNAKLLAPEKVNGDGTKIFLDPLLKKKVIWHDPVFGGSGRTFAPVLLKLLGEQSLDRFVREQVVFTEQMGDLVDSMARSEYAVSLGPILPNLLYKYEAAGIKLDIRPLGNTPEYSAYSNHGGSIMVVFNKRPHPAAAKLFINWYLSKETALGVAEKTGEDSARVDIPQLVPKDQQILPGVDYFDAQREANTPFARKAQAVIKEARKRQ
jgi:iron(III) transport system substrate-binding protein